MRIVVAGCTVDYEGRLAAHLPEARRLLVVKADGSVLVHDDGGGYKPPNRMAAPCALADHGDRWEVTNRRASVSPSPSRRCSWTRPSTSVMGRRSPRTGCSPTSRS